MFLVKLKGIKPGTNKIALTKFFWERCNTGLAKAKGLTDKLLAGESVELGLTSERLAIELSCAAEDLGVECSEYQQVSEM